MGKKTFQDASTDRDTACSSIGWGIKTHAENGEKIMEQNHLIIDLTWSCFKKHALRHDSVFEKCSPFLQKESFFKSLDSHRAHLSIRRLKRPSLPRVRAVWLHLCQPQHGSTGSSAPLISLEILQLQHLSTSWPLGGSTYDGLKVWMPIPSILIETQPNFTKAFKINE